MNKYQLIIFDWDGTLMDSLGFVVSCIQQAAAELQLPVPTLEEIRAGIGVPMLEQMRRLFVTDDTVNAMHELVRRKYLENPSTEELYHGVVPVLEHLQQAGFLLAVATNKSRVNLQAALQRSDLARFFVTTRCPEDGFAKPHPKMLESILQELAIEARNAVMVGDTIYDMELAQNAKVTAIAVGYGLHPKEKLLEYAPLACIDDIQQLPIILTGGIE